jgi:hypothetical protein
MLSKNNQFCVSVKVTVFVEPEMYMTVLLVNELHGGGHKSNTYTLTLTTYRLIFSSSSL